MIFLLYDLEALLSKKGFHKIGKSVQPQNICHKRCIKIYVPDSAKIAFEEFQISNDLF